MARKQAIGSNQYKRRVGSALISAAGDLVGHVESPFRRRCGEVWGTDCRAWVYAPTWTHWRHGRMSDRLAAVDNPGCSPEVLVQLAEDEIWLVRVRVAGHPNTPAETLVLLSVDTDRRVLVAVLGNPNLSEEYRLLGKLVR